MEFKGLYLDGSFREKPQGTWSYGKNGVIVSRGTSFISTNEEGFQYTEVQLDTDFISIGRLNIPNNKLILFGSYIGNLNITKSKIYIFDSNINTLTTLSTSDEWNFNPQYLVSGTYIPNSIGEVIIYFQDGYNPDRFLNIDNLPQTINQQTISIDFKLNYPKLDLSVNDFGGQCKCGAYQFAIKLIDENFNESPYISFSKVITINNEPSTDNDNYDGAFGGFPSSKSISIKISRLSGNIKYYKLVIIETLNFVDNYYTTPIQQLSSDLSNFIYTFNGDVSNFDTISASDILKSFGIYDSSKSFTQFKNETYITISSP